jgi:hypothetical protein
MPDNALDKEFRQAMKSAVGKDETMENGNMSAVTDRGSLGMGSEPALKRHNAGS